MSPSDVFMRGLNVAGALMDGASSSAFLKNPGTSLACVVAAAFTVLAFIGITIQFVVAMVESYIIVAAGVIFLGFGGSRWTAPYVERYIGLGVANGVKIMLLYLLIGVGMNISLEWIPDAQAVAHSTTPAMNAFEVMGAALIFLMLCWQIPKLFSAVLGGAPALTGGDYSDRNRGCRRGCAIATLPLAARHSPPVALRHWAASVLRPELVEAEQDQFSEAWARRRELGQFHGAWCYGTADFATFRSIPERPSAATRTTPEQRWFIWRRGGRCWRLHGSNGGSTPGTVLAGTQMDQNSVKRQSHRRCHRSAATTLPAPASRPSDLRRFHSSFRACLRNNGSPFVLPPSMPVRSIASDDAASSQAMSSPRLESFVGLPIPERLHEQLKALLPCERQ